MQVNRPGFGGGSQLLALLLSPIATELPETLNAVTGYAKASTVWHWPTSAAR